MKRFDYLDNYRGLLAVSVLLTHAGIWQYFFLHGQHFGVVCFFLLSSFLLTYQMLCQFSSKLGLMDALKLTIVYFIRRFFRIYVPFVVVLVIYKLLCDHTDLFGETDDEKGRFWKALRLDPQYYEGYISFTWTVPLEVRYYLAIPMVSLFGSIASRKDAWLVAYLIALTCTIVIIPSFQKVRFDHIHWYRTFVMGSMIAIVYKRFENASLKHYERAISFVTVAMFIVGSRLPFVLKIDDIPTKGIIYSVFWSVHLLLMLINQDNMFNIYLKKFAILKTLGNFSFGIYLFHMLGIRLTRYFYPLYKTAQPIHIMSSYMILAFIFSYIFHHSIELRSMVMSSYVCRKLHLFNQKQQQIV